MQTSNTKLNCDIANRECRAFLRAIVHCVESVYYNRTIFSSVSLPLSQKAQFRSNRSVENCKFTFKTSKSYVV